MIEDLMVHYYDPLYHITQKQNEMKIENQNSLKTAQNLIRFYS